ncbi:hypothetical protein [Clostridium formicaceticum]|uniref:NfeD-like C-terminal domain-containing protein n=1 Tax=Clostridium formicaceticum TaxID=1497 RepID=A0AAC9WF85_9CLOT|nr:hypothetical protein [Clostridium formicaceticum]AOY76138.1 hypothetical protein BJL90_09625 [Clostridium formicaceticum]ARE86506.1 hypothetical protein CLFO_08280 [Clostridium formicaceticum]
MIAWLSEALVLERIYWYLAIPFTVLFIIQLIATFLGLGDGDGMEGIEEGLDLDNDFEFESSLNLFTLRNFITFFTVFGWAGITFLNAGMGTSATLLLSTLLGIIMMLIVSVLFYFTMKLTHNGNMQIEYAKGATCQVYIRIPAKRSGIGKVNITFQDAFRELEAMTDDENAIPTGTVVQVKDILSNRILLVEKITGGD